MGPLQQDDPREIGPYTTLARLRETASSVRYLARDADGAAVVVIVPRAELAALPAFRRRFQQEDRTAERLAGGWVEAPLASRADADGGELWTAYPYLPSLTLSEAIALTGPLPERTVRILGAGLAETLSRVHATGSVLHGLTPDTVVLAADGPRLTAYGALGAAASAQAGPDGQLSVRLGYLTPEQLAGEKPGPASDLFVLGLLLAYAATGTTPLGDGAAIAHAEPELDSVPEELRALVARCLAKSPAERPSAGTVAADLALEGAAALARDGWLPAALITAVTAQETAVEGALTGTAPVVSPMTPPVRGGDPEDTGTMPKDAGGVTPAPADTATAGPVPDAGPETEEPSTRTEDAVPAGAAARDAGTAPVGAVPDTGPVALDPAARAGDAAPMAPGGGGAAPQGAQGVVPPHAEARTAHAPTTPTAPGASAEAPAAPPALAGGDRPTAQLGALPAGGVGDTRTTRIARLRGALREGGDRATTQLTLPGPRAPLPPVAAPPAAPPAASAPSAPAGGRFERRTLLTGIAAGAAGLLVGGGVVAAVSGDEATPPAKPKPVPRPAAVPGVPPAAKWRYEHPAAASAVAVHGERLLVLTGAAGTSAVDLRTGRRAWEQKAAASTRQALVAGTGLVFVVGADGFLWLSAADGKVVHRAPGAQGLSVAGVAGQSGQVVWFTGVESAPVAKKAARTYVVAYDTVRRKELWRSLVPSAVAPRAAAYELIAVRPTEVVLRRQDMADRGLARFNGFDRATGKALWVRYIPAVAPATPAAGDAEGRVFAALGGVLEAHGASGRIWRQPGGTTLPLGRPLRHGTALYAAGPSQTVLALDAASGAFRWKRSTQAPATTLTPELTVTTSGRTLLAADGTQVTAFGTGDGRRLWKFQDAGGAEDTADPYRTLPAGRTTVVVQRGRAFYALPVS
ncbi:PQQ-binding-like beta-propeller repeat protein [Streptomyces sp. NPDC000410]|uniref:outer membrane protein assembly factor BamB family protein n=1 Tax=Streptomyces sp. NPDC000410 TaxID=3154254 RepID=UPI0033334AB6